MTPYLRAIVAAVLLGAIVLAAGSNQSAYAKKSSPPDLITDSQSIQIAFNTTTNIQLNGTGPSGFKYEVTSFPSHGILAGLNGNNRTSTGAITYTPDANYAGTDSFTFITVKGSEQSATAATVDITVSAAPSSRRADWSGALAMMENNPNLDITQLPESTSGVSFYEALNGPLAVHLLDALRVLDLYGVSIGHGDLTEGQFIYLLEHFDELASGMSGEAN